MFRLPEPVQSFSESIDDCGNGIAIYSDLKGKLSAAKGSLIVASDEYTVAGRLGSLHSLASFQGGPTEVVLSGITKQELVRVYEQYFVPEGKLGRRVYDSIMAAAQEKCSFCGGIGTPRNLDHFLAKAYFPQFSVLPLNLVPACRDCNMDGKRSDVVTAAEDQPLHPYLDDGKFFREQWVYATFHPDATGDLGEYRYFVSPPDSWSASEKARVARHFERFELARRYAVKAAEHLGTLLSQIERLRHYGLGDEDVRHVLLEPGADQVQFVNHWKRPMYQAWMR